MYSSTILSSSGKEPDIYIAWSAKSAISDSEMFDDYIEYKVLSEIAQKEASKKGKSKTVTVILDTIFSFLPIFIPLK